MTVSKGMADKEQCIEERLEKLRNLRAKLCKKETNWQEAFKVRDWMVDQLKTLHDMSHSEVHTKKDIAERLEDILCALEPSEGSEDE